MAARFKGALLLLTRICVCVRAPSILMCSLVVDTTQREGGTEGGAQRAGAGRVYSYIRGCCKYEKNKVTCFFVIIGALLYFAFSDMIFWVRIAVGYPTRVLVFQYHRSHTGRYLVLRFIPAVVDPLRIKNVMHKPSAFVASSHSPPNSGTKTWEVDYLRC